MNDIVLILNQSFYNLSAFSLAASLLWGVLSVFLSPCHVASIPLIVAYVNDHEEPDRKSAFTLSLLFGLGILLMIILMGVVTGLMGRILGDVGTPLLITVYLLLLLCGVWLLEPPFMKNFHLSLFRESHRSQQMGAFSLGFLYGLVLGPCSFAFLAPMIGIVFTRSMSQLWFGIGLFFFYGIGHTAAIVAAGSLGAGVVTLFENANVGRASVWIKRLCGALIITYSLYKIIEAFH
jgi:cytochrome c-type biogenesis protein